MLSIVARMPAVALLCSIVALSSPGKAQGSVSVVSEHDTLRLGKGRKATTYRRWTAAKPLEIRAIGPVVAELWLRPVVSGSKGKMEIAAVRQDTRRSKRALRIHSAEIKMKKGKVAKEHLRIHIQVPSGEHRYQLNFKGDPIEVLFRVNKTKRYKKALALKHQEESATPIARGGQGDDSSGGATATQEAQPLGENTVPPASEESLDFDLLGEASEVKPVDTSAVATRRLMLNVHQGLGIGLVIATVSLCVLGQLSYADRFGGGDTGQWEQPHAIAAYSTVGLFAATGIAAAFAPHPYAVESDGLDRTLLHKIGLTVAAVAMVSATVMGLKTAGREGLLDHRSYAQAHLAVSYTALAAMLGSVAVLVF